VLLTTTEGLLSQCLPWQPIHSLNCLFYHQMQACRNNGGVIASGLRILLTPGFGKFDSFLYTSSDSIRKTLMPAVSQEYDWRNTYLDEDLKRRGITDIPNFLYKDDAGRLYTILEEFATSYIGPYYQKQGVEKDEQLQAFLKDMSSVQPGASAYIKGFPGPEEIKDEQDVYTMVTQMMWLTGASHHAFNTLKVSTYMYITISLQGN